MLPVLWSLCAAAVAFADAGASGGSCGSPPAAVAATPVAGQPRADRTWPSAVQPFRGASGGGARALVGAAADDAAAFAGVGLLVALRAEGHAHVACSATLVAPDVLLTAAHCLPASMAADGWLRPAQALTRLLWVSATRPFPLGRQRTYEAVAGATLPGYDPEFWRLYEAPLIERCPRTAHEREVLAAYERACGDGDRLFEAQQRLRCLTALPPALQRALGFADADWSARDVALLFLDRPVTGVAPVRIAQGSDASPPAPEGAPVTVVGYGWSERTPSPAWLFVHPWGTRRKSSATVFAVGNHQLQLEEDAPVCYGDSGGPVLRRAEDGAAEVVGVSSAMLPRGARLCGPHATYMRADAVRPWVQATMAAACRDGRRSAAGCAASGAGW